MSYSTSLDWEGRVLVVKKHSGGGTGMVDIWQVHEPDHFRMSQVSTIVGICNGSSIPPADAVKMLEMVTQNVRTTILLTSE